MASINSLSVRHKIVILTAIFFLIGLVALVLSGTTGVRHLADDIVSIYLIAWGLYAFLSTTPRDEIRKRFVLTTTVLAGLLVLLEFPAWLGYADYRRVFSTYTMEPWQKPGYTFDDELLWVHQPHYESKGKYVRGNIGEYLCLPPGVPQAYDAKYDRNGFRNETDLTSADVAIVGDSYIEAVMTPTRSLLTTVLEKTGQMTVANLGTSGYGPQQELAVLKRYALPLHPKTIVWVFYEGNDLRDVHVYEQNKRAVTRQSFEGKLDRSFTKNVLEGVLRLTRGCVPDPYLERNYGTMVDKNGNRSRIYFVDAGMPLSDDDIEALKKTQAALAEAYRLSRERGIRFVVVFAPTTFRVHHGLSNLVEVSANVKKWVVNDLPDRLRAIVNGISPEIDYVDLTPILKAEVERGNQVFLSDDTHWTNEGHRIVAQTIQSFALDGSTQFAKRPDQSLRANSFVDWTHKALMVRATDGTIKYWNKGAEQLYGWKPKDTVGKTSHRLLKTVFPKPLPSIEAELSRTGRWEGELVHKRRDGSQVVVASRWELQRNGSGQTPLVIEINSERSPGSDPEAPQKFNN